MASRSRPRTSLTILGLGIALTVLLQPASVGISSLHPGHELGATPAIAALARPVSDLLRPSEAFGAGGMVSVNQTLVLANNSSLRGNFVPPAGGHPVFPFFDSLDGLLYVSDTLGGQLLVLDPQNNSWQTPFHLGGSPDAIGVDPLNGLLYVTNLLGNSVFVVNPTNGTIVANVTVGQAPSGVVFDPSNGAMLVTDQKSNQISIINATFNRLVANATGWDSPYGIAYDAADGHVYVTNHNDTNNLDGWKCRGKASVYSSNGSLRFLHNVSVGFDPNGIAYDPVNQDLYVANDYGCGITVINGTDDKPLGTFPPGGAEQLGIPAPWGVTVDPRTDHVFVTVIEYEPGLNGTILMINGSENRITALIHVDGQVRWLADDPLLGRVYAADDRAMDVMVVDAQSDTLVGDDLTGALPGAMVFNPINRELYVLNPNSSVVIAVNTTTDTVQRKIYVGPGAGGLAYDPVTGNVVVSLVLEGALIEINATTDEARWFATDRTTLLGNDPTALLFTASRQLLNVETGGQCPGPLGTYGDCIDVRSPSSGNLASTLYIPATPDGSALASNPISQSVFFSVTTAYGTGLDVLDVAKMKWSREITVGSDGIYSPSIGDVGNDSVLYDLGNNRIYLGNCGGNDVTILNGTSYAIVGNISVPDPTALAYDSDDGLILVASQDGFVLVVNGTTDQVVGTVQVGALPDGLAYDPNSDQLFVANNASGTISILNLSEETRVPNVTLSESTAVVRAGLPVNFQVTVTGGSTGFHYEYGLPPGCASADVAVLVCTPTVPGDYWVTAGVYQAGDRSSLPNAVPLKVTQWLYPINFTEIGLPPGTPWRLIGSFGLATSNSSLLQILLPNASYDEFYVPSVAGYVASPSGDQSFGVSGAGLSIPIRFQAIEGPLTVVSFAAAPPSIRVGALLTVTVNVTGGVAPYAFLYTHPPPGCASENAAVLTCTPTAPGSYLLSVEVTDQSGQSTNGSLQLAITPLEISRVTLTGPPSGFLGLPPPDGILILALAATGAAGLGALAVLRREWSPRTPPSGTQLTPSSAVRGR